MDSIRQSKVSRLLQKEMGQMFQKESGTYVPGGLITVTVVRVTPDLGLAKVYLSIFPSSKADDAIELINKSAKSLRFLLGKEVRHQLRVIPELAFYLDDSLDYAERIDELLK